MICHNTQASTISVFYFTTNPTFFTNSYNHALYYKHILNKWYSIGFQFYQILGIFCPQRVPMSTEIPNNCNSANSSKNLSESET